LYITKLATDKQTRDDTVKSGQDIGLDPDADVNIDNIPTDVNVIVKDSTGFDPYQVIPDTEKAIENVAKDTGKAISKGWNNIFGH